MDLRKQVLTQKSFPEIDTVDYGHHPPQRFLSVPDIRVGSGASKSAKPISRSKTKLGVSVKDDFFWILLQSCFLFRQLKNRDAEKDIVFIIIIKTESLHVLGPETSIPMTQINVYIINLVVMGFQV